MWSRGLPSEFPGSKLPEGGEKGSDCGHELKAEPTGLVNGFDVGAESKEELVLLQGLGAAGSSWSQEILSQVLRAIP